jgi:hypothetical protein
MKTRFFRAAVLLTMTLVLGCAQFTTSKEELADMDSIAQARANEYIDCIKREAAGMSASTDASFLRDAAMQRCEPQLDAYKEAQSDYLNGQFMMISKELDASVAALDKRARNEIAEMLVSQPGMTPTPTPAFAPAVAAATAATAPAVWNADQRIYLDCMQDQGEKYASLDESVDRIADVASTRCRSYLGTEARQALEQEGRAVVMGAVFDARLEAVPGQ